MMRCLTAQRNCCKNGRGNLGSADVSVSFAGMIGSITAGPSIAAIILDIVICRRLFFGLRWPGRLPQGTPICWRRNRQTTSRASSHWPLRMSRRKGLLWS